MSVETTSALLSACAALLACWLAVRWWRRRDADEVAPIRDPDTEWHLSGLAEAARRRRVPPTLGERLQRVAASVGGRLVIVSSSVVGHVTWRRNGRRFYYYETSLENGWWSFVALRLNVPQLPVFQVMPRGGSTPFPPLAVSYLGYSGVPRFDQRFEVRLAASDLLAERPPMAPAACAQLVLLDRLLPLPPFLAVEPVRCRVCLPGFLLQAIDSDRALEEACRLIETVLASHGTAPGRDPGSGIILDVMTLRDDAAATCRVCGEVVAGEHVRCARCGTPHHADCWEYTGGCSVFACQCQEKK